VVALIGCYFGLRASGGTQGVGRATTQAVVATSITILLLDVLLAQVLLGK
jgi:phospholipid/cholesterol/gamma-HCH transport system permease protein